MPPSVQELHAKLDAWWEAVDAIKPDSPKTDLDKFASFLAPDVEAYFNGMGSAPAKGREGCIAAISQLSNFWAADRKVISRTGSSDGLTIVAEMKNDLTVFGEALDGFPETEVVEYTVDGLIKSYRLYVDPAPVMEIVQRKTAEQR